MGISPADGRYDETTRTAHIEALEERGLSTENVPLNHEERLLTSSYEWGESEEVIALQELLGLPADGTYGQKTRVAHLQALAQQVPWFRTDNVPSPPQTIDKLEASISSTGATVEGLRGPVISDITFPKTYDSTNQWMDYTDRLTISARVTGEDLTLVYLESYSGPICNNARHIINLRGDAYSVENMLDLTTPYGRAQLLEGEVANFTCLVYNNLPAGPMNFRFGATDEHGNLTISEEFTVEHCEQDGSPEIGDYRYSPTFVGDSGVFEVLIKSCNGLESAPRITSKERGSETLDSDNAMTLVSGDEYESRWKGNYLVPSCNVGPCGLYISEVLINVEDYPDVDLSTSAY